MKFQTKLLLAILTSVLGVVVVIVVVADRRLAAAETRRFSKEFRAQVDFLRDSRRERSEGILPLCRKMAESKIVRKVLESELTAENTDSFYEQLRKLRDNGEKGTTADPIPGRFRQNRGPGTGAAAGGSQRTGGGQKTGGGGSAGGMPGAIPVMGVMDLNGEFQQLQIGGKGQTSQRKGQRKLSRPSNSLRPLIETLKSDPEQQHVGYLPMRTPGAQEVTVTPVTDPSTGEVLGAFIMGIPAITGAERSLDQLEQSMGKEEVVQTAIYMEDQLFAREMDEERKSELLPIMAKRLDEGSGESGTGEFTATLGGEPYRIHYLEMNPDSALPPAYQVAAFPLRRLVADLVEIRKNGIIFGAVSMALFAIVALLVSRSLSGPIRDLSAGTEAVREGMLDTRVRVRSRDELGRLAESFNAMTEELGQKEKYRELLGKVSDEAVAQAMIEGTLNLELGGEVKEVSILFCDIRGFTGMTESMPPAEVIELLNAHMTAMTAVVRTHYGVVDKFVGDEIMAVFGGLKSYGNDARNAVACALDMVAERQRLNEALSQPFEIGIGIATGEAVAGCMGSNDRLNYTVLGARVNLAARLAGEAGRMQIIVDEATRNGLDSDDAVERLDDIQLKGFSESVTAYRLDAEGNLSFRESNAEITSGKG